MSVIAQSCRLATNPRTGEPFSIVASDGEAESKERAGWPVVEYVPADQLQGAVRERDTALVDRARLVAEVERLRSDAWKWRHLAADAAADLNRREREITRLEAMLDDTTRSLDDAEAEAERRHFAAIEDADEIRGFTDYPPEQ